MDDAYFAAHSGELEALLSDAVNASIATQPSSLAHFFADFFAAAAAVEHPQLSSLATKAVTDARESCDMATSSAAKGGSWTTKGWLDSLDVTDALTAALLAPLGSDAGDSGLQLQYVRALASAGDVAGRECIHSLLRDGPLLGLLADQIWDGAKELAGAKAAHAAELHEKFCAEGGTFTMSFSGLSTFFGGLEALIGAPNPNLVDAMTKEHRAAADSSQEFVTPNYSMTTSSETEWLFVTDPQDGLAQLGKSAWPSEHARFADDVRRQPLPLSSFDETRREVNARLNREDVAPVGEAEFVACRLYTGPLFVKYNLVLRGSSGLVPWFVEELERTCRGNKYVTTLHACNSAVVKLGKLTSAATVYRGVSGLLPDEFWTPNRWGVCGGVE